MKRRIRLGILLTGLGLLAVAHGAVLPPEGAEYKGQKLCIACHKAKNKGIVEAYPQTAHANAMAEATDETIVADFTAAPFDRAKVKYVLASGRHEQAYLDENLQVLPAKWIVGEKRWEPIASADGAAECVGCHVTNFDPETKTWTALGVGCEMCHGPGGKHTSAKADQRMATIVTPEDLDPKHQMMVCGRCHSKGRDQSAKYAWPQGFLPGQDLDACFVDSEPTEPGNNQQYSDLRRSPKHFDNGVICETCHDPHGDTNHEFQLRDGVTEGCLKCHQEKIQSLEAHVVAKGRKVPANATCATCHMPNGRHLFDRTIVPAD